MVAAVFIKFAIAAAAGGSAWALNRHAKSREEQAREVQRAANGKYRAVTESLEEAKAALQERLSLAQSGIRTIRDTCEARSRPVLEFYAVELAQVKELALPPGFDRIEAMAIPPLVKGIDGNVNSYWLDQKLSESIADRTRMLMNVSSPYGGAILSRENAGVLAAASALSDVAERHTAASQQLTKARERFAEAQKLEAEVEGLKTSFAAVGERGAALLEKMTEIEKHFQRYIGRCEALHGAVRHRDALEREEWQWIEYLARIQTCLAATAQEPLA